MTLITLLDLLGTLVFAISGSLVARNRDFDIFGALGVNQQWVIGTKASHGCIRMYNRDVRQLFPSVPLGTMVYTRR